ncbi:MAG: YihY/virulence factor BrkB family protein [Acidobacteria bacterium]|nr:YihY/virulence factor BrkB family protein [Acidobacteriota bacterium]MBI3423902.1 YihY/virulence factor BrkB family protein [Acidobacteriota bacterium]
MNEQTETAIAPPAAGARGFKFYAQGTWLFLKKMWPAIWDLTESETYVHASSIAFNVLMSFFSFLVLLGSFLVNVLGWQQGYETCYRLMIALVPAESRTLFDSLDQVTRGPGGKATLVSFALLIFSSSGIFQPLELALNRSWKFPERNVIKQYLLYMPLVLVCSVIILLAIAIASPWDYLLGKLLGDAAIRKPIFAVIATIISLPFLVLLFFAVYYVVPNGKVHRVQIFFASAATAVLWMITTLGFRVVMPLLDFKGSYKQLSSLMALITWVFISSFILILGANLSARDVLPKSWTRSK